MRDIIVDVKRSALSVELRSPAICVRAAYGGTRSVYPPDYEGAYDVAPSDEDIVLPTDGRYLHGDITVAGIPAAHTALRRICVLDLYELPPSGERRSDTLYLVRG